MRKLSILLMVGFLFIALNGVSQTTDPAVTAPAEPEAQGVVLIDVYNDQYDYVGQIPLEFNIADSSIADTNIPPIVREITVTYGIQNRWGNYTEINQVVITSSNWYSGGNKFLLDLLSQLPPDVTDGIENPKRKSITIIHTGFLRPGTILSTKTPGWNKGLLIMGN